MVVRDRDNWEGSSEQGVAERFLSSLDEGETVPTLQQALTVLSDRLVLLLKAEFD